jgi:hypothetical protein
MNKWQFYPGCIANKNFWLKRDHLSSFGLSFFNVMAKSVKRSVGRVNQIGITIKERDASIPLKGLWETSVEVLSKSAFLCWCDGTLEAWRPSGHFDLFYKSMPIFFEQIYF